MISEITFSKKFTAFWNILLPNAKNHIRLINSGLMQACYAPFEESKRKENNALVNVISFDLLRRVINRNLSNAEISKAGFLSSELISEILGDALRYLSRFSYGNECNLPLNIDELEMIVRLYGKMYLRYVSDGRKLIVDPLFSGCGFLNESTGDLLKEGTLIEIKSGERKFSIVDFRQLLVYCTLNHFSKKPHKITHIALFNPRMGISFVDELDKICNSLSALSSQELFSEIHTYITNNNFVEEYGT